MSSHIAEAVPACERNLATVVGFRVSSRVMCLVFSKVSGGGFAELIYSGDVVQLMTLQQFCRYDIYEWRCNLQVCADFCNFS